MRANLTKTHSKPHWNLIRTDSNVLPVHPFFNGLVIPTAAPGEWVGLHHGFNERKPEKTTTKNRNCADNKATPLTIQESQTQIVIPPTKSMDNENYEEKLSRKEQPTFKANDSRQEVTVEVHPKRYHSLPNLRKK